MNTPYSLPCDWTHMEKDNSDEANPFISIMPWNDHIFLN